MKTNTSGRKGFTLVEIMIVVAIVGLLCAIAIPNLMRARVFSMTNACVSNLREIDSAKQQWALELGKGINESPQPDDLKPYMGHGLAGSIARVHCPLAKPPAPMAGYNVKTMADLPQCLNFNAVTHNALIQ